MKRTIIYVRVSTEDQLEKYGLPAQLRACREYAKAHGLDIIAEIADEGISGVILDRPGIDRVRQMVRDGTADVVLILDPDRLSRELAHLLILKPEIEKRARLEFVTCSFEKTPTGELFFDLKGSIAKYERAVTRDRTMRGKRERALSGKIVGGRTAYGYRYDDGALVLDEPRASTVRSIYEWFLAGVSIRSIALRLRSLGAPTWGGRSWGHSSVRRILINETYAGVAHYGTLRREGKLLRKRSPEQRITILVPALISREEWDRAQARLAENPQNGRPSSSYLLRGLLFCTCGRRMSGEKKRNYRSYRCSGRDALRLGGEACRYSVNARTLDQVAWSALMAVLTDGDALRALLEKHQAALREASSPERAAQLARDVRKLKARESRCLELMSDPDLAEDRAAIKAKYLEAQRERRVAESALSAQSAAVAAATDESWIDETTELLSEYLPTLTDPEQKQEFLRGLLTRANWDGVAEVTLDCFLGAKVSTSSARCAGFQRVEFVVKARFAA
jgi:site-specific DNA recombinase